jgi:hypothetical protein
MCVPHGARSLTADSLRLTRPIRQMMLEKSLAPTANFAVVVAEHQTLGTFMLQVM